MGEDAKDMEMKEKVPLLLIPSENRDGHPPLKSCGSSNGMYFDIIVVKFDLLACLDSPASVAI